MGQRRLATDVLPAAGQLWYWELVSMQSYTLTFAAVVAMTACGGDALDGSNGGAGTGDSATGGATTGGAGKSSIGGALTGGTSTTGSTTGGGEATPDASCDDSAAPCGGKVVGTWSVVSSCLEVSGEVDLVGLGLTACTTPVAGTLEVGGMLTLYEDGTLKDDTTTTGESEFLVSLAVECVGISEMPSDGMCAHLGPVLQSLGYASVVCVYDEASDGCACAATVDQTGGGPGFVSPEASPSGTHTTASNVLTASYVSDVEYDYCVPGNFMTLAPRTVSVTGTVTGEIVLQLQ